MSTLTVGWGNGLFIFFAHRCRNEEFWCHRSSPGRRRAEIRCRAPSPPQSWASQAHPPAQQELCFARSSSPDPALHGLLAPTGCSGEGFKAAEGGFAPSPAKRQRAADSWV